MLIAMTALLAAKLVLLVAAVAFVLVGSIRLGVRALRFVRRHRGEVSTASVGEWVRGWVTAALEDWVDVPRSAGDASDEAGEDDAGEDVTQDSPAATDSGHSGDSSSH